MAVGGSGGGDLNPSGDLELIAAEGGNTDGDTPRQRLLGSAHSAMRDSARRAIEDRPMWGKWRTVALGGTGRPSLLADGNVATTW